MGDFPYLDWLTSLYKEKAEKSGKWVDCIKAHGLANACIARASTKERLERAYEIESQWYNGTHPLPPDDYQRLIEDHKQSLQNFRELVNVSFQNLKIEEQNIGISKALDETEIEKAFHFSHKVFSASKACSDGFVQLSQRIIESSITVLDKFGLGHPSCSFAVIGLGSVARGEATPYSDLEYAFIVDNGADMDYFMKLAIDSYFRIGNCGETPLKCFNIAEMRLKDDQNKPFFKDKMKTVGYKFDGITSKAGNIPSGNGLTDGKCLILTVEELMELYKTELLAPAGDIVGDLSDLLSSTVLIYANEGGTSLYQDFLAKRMAYETSKDVQDNEYVQSKRLKTLSQDIQNYEFIPDRHHNPFSHHSDITVKPAIFRYPTLLATNIKICLTMDTCYPWDTYSKLHDQGYLSTENYHYMVVILGLSIYLRVATYLSLKTQSDQLSVFTNSQEKILDRYYVPQNVFVFLGRLLIPLKNGIKLRLFGDTKQKVPPLTSIDIRSLFDLHMATSNPMIHAEVLLFVGQFESALEVIYEFCGKRNVNEDCGKFIDVISHKLGSSKETIDEYVSLCYSILIFTNNFAGAVSYAKWLAEQGTSFLSQAEHKTAYARCLKNVHDYQTALAVVDEVFVLLKNTMAFDSNQTLPEYIMDDLTKGTDFSVKKLTYYQIAATNYHIKGQIYYNMKSYKQTEEYLSLSLMLCHLLQKQGVNMILSHRDMVLSAATLYHDTGNFVKSHRLYGMYLFRLKSIHGEDTNHPDIANGYNDLGKLYADVGEYQKAIEYYTKSHAMRKALHGNQFDHTAISNTYVNLGNLYSKLGEYNMALDCHRIALEMNQRLFSEETAHADVADCYNNLGNVYSLLSRDQEALEYHRKSLQMKTALPNIGENRLAIAASYNNIGKIYFSLSEHQRALEYFLQASDIFVAIYGETSKHPDIAAAYGNIGLAYLNLGNNSDSLHYQTKSLEMKQALFGGKVTPDLAIGYLNLGILEFEMGQHQKSLERYTRSLAMFKRLYGEHSTHPHIAINIVNIANTHVAMGQYEKSLEYFLVSLRMSKANHKDAAHYDIANTYNSIAVVYDKMGLFPKSLQISLKSLKMLQELYSSSPNHPAIVDNYCLLGNVASEMGSFSDSLKYFKVAAELLENDVEREAKLSLVNDTIGSVYVTIGRYTDSFRYVSKALKLKEKAYSLCSDLTEMSQSYLLFGDAYRQCNQVIEAFFCYNKAIVSAVGPKQNVLSDTLYGIGELWVSMEEYEWAIKFLQICFKLAVGGKNKTLKADVCLLIGKCYRHLGHWRKSWLWLYMAVCGYQSLPQSTDCLISRTRLYIQIGYLLMQLNHVTHAVEHAQRAVDLTNTLLADQENTISVYVELREEAVALRDTLDLISSVATV